MVVQYACFELACARRSIFQILKNLIFFLLNHSCFLLSLFAHTSKHRKNEDASTSITFEHTSTCCILFKKTRQTDRRTNTVLEVKLIRSIAYLICTVYQLVYKSSTVSYSTYPIYNDNDRTTR